MTAIVSLFGFVARFAGDLLNTATGWAGTLMFGRVPQSHRRYLTAMLGGSVLWVVLVIVFLVPGILQWSLQTTPHPSFITSSWLAFVILSRKFRSSSSSSPDSVSPAMNRSRPPCNRETSRLTSSLPPQPGPRR